MVLVEVIGVDPPCKRCAATQNNAEKAASILKSEGIEVTVKKLDIASKETVSKYGVILSPALAVNGKVRVAGRIPSPEEIVRIIKETV
ncbi:MAG: thioredoxin family protein [Candidatus Bathyarchaeia archaeon]